MAAACSLCKRVLSGRRREISRLWHRNLYSATCTNVLQTQQSYVLLTNTTGELTLCSLQQNNCKNYSNSVKDTVYVPLEKRTWEESSKTVRDNIGIRAKINFKIKRSLKTVKENVYGLDNRNWKSSSNAVQDNVHLISQINWTNSCSTLQRNHILNQFVYHDNQKNLLNNLNISRINNNASYSVYNKLMREKKTVSCCVIGRFTHSYVNPLKRDACTTDLLHMANYPRYGSTILNSNWSCRRYSCLAASHSPTKYISLLSTHGSCKDSVQAFRASPLPPPQQAHSKGKAAAQQEGGQLRTPPKPQTLRRLLSIAQPERWTLAGGLALLCVSSAVTMSVPFIVGALIDGIYASGPTAAVPAVASWSLEAVCGALAAVFLVGGAANSGRVYLMTTAGQRISQTLRSRVFSSLLNQETGYFDRNSTGVLVSRLAADTPLVAAAVTTTVSDGTRAVVMASVAVGMMVYTSAPLALFGVSVVPPVALLAAASARRLRGIATAVQDELAVCIEHAEERLSNIRTVRLFAQEKREQRHQHGLLQQALVVMYKDAAARAVFFGLTGLTGNMLVLAVLYRGSSLVAQEQLSVGSLTAFMLYAAYVGIAVSGVSAAYTELARGAGAADRLFELIDRRPEMAPTGGLQFSPCSVKGSVEFKGVHFCYPTRPNTPVFSGLDLCVPQGGVVAVVGGSGCGKSTVVALLLRLYDPQSGSITLDGRDLRTLDPASLRAAIGVVSQDPVLFSGSIRSNLLYGVADPLSVTEDRLLEAAEQAHALTFIQDFPQGLDTVVGERGVLLSGGQRQRLAIARALITDPRILCLDEATSALDSESEHLVQEAVERLMRGRTVITIAHRLSTIRGADQVAVLQGGRVVEMGGYAELLNKPDGVFSTLVRRQALGPLTR